MKQPRTYLPVGKLHPPKPLLIEASLSLLILRGSYSDPSPLLPDLALTRSSSLSKLSRVTTSKRRTTVRLATSAMASLEKTLRAYPACRRACAHYSQPQYYKKCAFTTAFPVVVH
jgi:hypothetical protein